MYKDINSYNVDNYLDILREPVFILPMSEQVILINSSFNVFRINYTNTFYLEKKAF